MRETFFKIEHSQIPLHRVTEFKTSRYYTILIGKVFELLNIYSVTKTFHNFISFFVQIKYILLIYLIVFGRYGITYESIMLGH